MKLGKRILILLLHAGCTYLVQRCLFRLLLGESALGFGTALLTILPGILACAADLVCSCLLMRGDRMGPRARIALHFWDFVMIFPALIFGFLGFLSDGEGKLFGTLVLLLELLLILERSISYVLLEPARQD